jgi:CRISPR system Cascade subunit CasA
MQYDGEEKPFEANGEDLPAWEQALRPARERVPAGYVDYLTFQWRRVRLFWADDRAVKVAVHAGDRLPKIHSSADYEMTIAYTKSAKKPGDRYTVRLNLSRSLWRDSAAFLQSSDAGTCPRIIAWLAELQGAKLVANWLNLQVLGLTVDNAKPLGWVSEQLSAPMAYITEKPLWLALNSALQFAEQHQQLFRTFRGSPYGVLAEELNHPDAGSFAKSLDGESQYWARLDRDFQDLLHRQLPADKTLDGNGTTYGHQALRDWEKTVQAAATQAFTESIASIRNYQARAGALRSLNYHLAKLRGDIKEKSDKGKKPARKAQPKAS